MKKLILLTTCIALSYIGFAQIKPAIRISAGLSSSSIKGETNSQLNDLLDYTNGMVTTKNHTGFFAGASAGIPLSKMMSIEPGIYYTQKGYELNGDLNFKSLSFLGANAKAKLQSSYIDIPVLLKANINGFQIFAGPQVSYLAKADLKASAGLLGFNLLNKTWDVTDQFNRWDMGVTGGIGYQLPNGLGVHFSYDRGLSKVDANKNTNSYNQVFKAGISYSF
jgi:hypothetical protein